MKSLLGLRGRNFPPYAVGLSLSPTSTHPSHATSYATGTRKSLIYIASHRIVNLIRRYPQVYLRCLRAHRSVRVSLSSHQFFSFNTSASPQAIAHHTSVHLRLSHCSSHCCPARWGYRLLSPHALAHPQADLKCSSMLALCAPAHIPTQLSSVSFGRSLRGLSHAPRAL